MATSITVLLYGSLSFRRDVKNRPEKIAKRQIPQYAPAYFAAVGARRTDIKKIEAEMLSKLLTSLVLLALVAAVGGFVLLAFWDVPVEQLLVEKTLDSTRFLQKST
jgi:hypothetical protein